MNIMKIQIEILKEMLKQPCNIACQLDAEDIIFSNGEYAVRIPQDSCCLTLEHKKIRRIDDLKEYFESRSNSYIVERTTSMLELEPKILIRKMESKYGNPYCWINEKYYKLFGNKYQYLVTAPDEALQVIDDSKKIIAIIMPVKISNLYEGNEAI